MKIRIKRIGKRIRNLVLILLWARTGIHGQSEQLTGIPVLPLPQETIDTLIIRHTALNRVDGPSQS